MGGDSRFDILREVGIDSRCGVGGHQGDTLGDLAAHGFRRPDQDHRRVQHRLGPMLGLKSFRTAAVVIGGIELAEKIKKGPFKVGKLGGTKATTPEIWRAALAA